MTKMTGFVVAQYLTAAGRWRLKVLGMSCLLKVLSVCLFFFSKVGTLQVQVHVHTGIQISVYFLYYRTYVVSCFLFSFCFSPSFPGLFCLIIYSFARQTTTTTTEITI